MLAPQSGQTRLRIVEIKSEFVFVTTAYEAIMSLPVVAVLPRQMHRTLSAGPQAHFGEGAGWKEATAPRFGFKRMSNRVAKCCAGNEGFISRQMSSRRAVGLLTLKFKVGLTKCAFRSRP
jgi:hypothetical protein